MIKNQSSVFFTHAWDTRTVETRTGSVFDILYALSAEEMPTE